MSGLSIPTGWALAQDFGGVLQTQILCHCTHAFGRGQCSSEIKRKYQGVPKCAGENRSFVAASPKLAF